MEQGEKCCKCRFGFIPVVGNIKGAIEGIVGYDLAGNKLEPWERALGLAGPAGKLLKKGYRAVKALNEIDKFADIAKDVERVEEGVMDISKLNEANKIIRTEGTQLLLEASKNIHKHHILPQKFKSWFESRGITNINDFTVEISQQTHLKGVHGKGLGNLPGKWNDRWTDFILANPEASASEIFHFAEGMSKRYGLEHLPYVKY